MSCSLSCKHHQHTERTTGAANFSGVKQSEFSVAEYGVRPPPHACEHVCVICTHTRMHTCAHTHTHTCTGAHTHIYICTCTHTNTHTHISAHTHTHTHTHYHNLLSKSSSKNQKNKKRRNPNHCSPSGFFLAVCSRVPQPLKMVFKARRPQS